VHEAEREILFGLYSNSYLHGHNYLTAIAYEDLLRLLDNYNNSMAKITNDEAMLVLDIAAKRYVERIEHQIHAAWVVTKRQELDNLNAEYDAKIDALEADEYALETKRQELELARDKAQQRIEELQIQIELEGINAQMVDIEIAEQQLRAARADLELLNAQIEGLNIQLAIAQAGIDLVNAELQVTEIENREANVDIDISEVELAE
jgi:multidrug resistance efflux pump